MSLVGNPIDYTPTGVQERGPYKKLRIYE